MKATKIKNTDDKNLNDIMYARIDDKFIPSANITRLFFKIICAATKKNETIIIRNNVSNLKLPTSTFLYTKGQEILVELMSHFSQKKKYLY
jgi:hypothetical protein